MDMNYTNLYIAFEKIKKCPHPNLPGISDSDFTLSKSEKELNEKLNKSIRNLVKNENELAGIEYVSIKGDGDYNISGMPQDNSYLKIYHYHGYKYLFLEYKTYVILLNFAPDGEDIFYRRKIEGKERLEYLPLDGNDNFYILTKNKKFYVVNTYGAFCNYTQAYLVEELHRQCNSDFFSHALDLLFCNRKLFSKNEQYQKNMNKPYMTKVRIENEDRTAEFTYIIFDKMIIVADFSYPPEIIVGNIVQHNATISQV